MAFRAFHWHGSGSHGCFESTSRTKSGFVRWRGIFIMDEPCASHALVVPFNRWHDRVIPRHFCASGSAKRSNFGKKR